MNKLIYWVGLPAVFVVLAGATFLIPKTYESHFVVAVESQLAIEQNRVMTLNRPENYDLGVIRTDNMMSRYCYKEIIHSDVFIRQLLDMPVKTVDGSFEGSYMAFLHRKDKAAKANKEKTDSTLQWISLSQENAARTLRGAIDVKVDYESRLITISCQSEDPLVSNMMARNVQKELAVYIRHYELEKMELTLTQLQQLTAQAKAAWEKEPTGEKEQIYKSFERQQVVYQAQMMNVPAFTTLAAPSFSYRKVAPSRWKIPMALTLLIGLSVWGWENRKKLAKFV